MLEVLIYGDINEYSAREFFERISEGDGKDITCRVNTDGGSIDFGWGMITKFMEMKGKKFLKNDGKAYSMGAFAFLYADDSEATDVAEFMFHRCGLRYTEWEQDVNFFTPEDRARMERRNKSLRKAFEAKIDVQKFEEITGVTVDELFSMDGRPEVFLTAKQAKQIGLINRIVTITPTKTKEISAKLAEVEAKYVKPAPQANKPEIKQQNSKNKIMTIAEFKAEHPSIYADIVAQATASATEAAVTKERDRISAWQHFSDVDPTAVKEGIASGKDMTQIQIIELTAKKMNPAAIAKHEEGSEKNPLNTEAPAGKEKPAEQKEIEAFAAGVEANSNYFKRK
jgi:ATP-dependent protease ClpP protease subunit